MPANRRLTPIQDRRTGNTNIRWLDRGGSKAAQSTQWASCQDSVKVAFRRSPSVFSGSSFYLSGSDLGLIGLAGAALLAPLSLAWTGPAAAYWLVAEGVIINSSSIAAAIPTALTAGALAGFIRPKEVTYANINKPCDKNASKY
jgi:hypothetical protein